MNERHITERLIQARDSATSDEAKLLNEAFQTIHRLQNQLDALPVTLIMTLRPMGYGIANWSNKAFTGEDLAHRLGRYLDESGLSESVFKDLSETIDNVSGRFPDHMIEQFSSGFDLPSFITHMVTAQPAR